MENVVIRVRLEDNKAVATLTQVDSLVKQLQGKTVSLKVDTAGLEKINSNVTKALQAQAKLASAQAKTAQAQAQQANLEKQITLQREKTATAAENARKAAEQTASQVQKTLQAEQRTAQIEQQRALLAERMAAAYDRLAMRTSSTASGTSTTGLQSQINAMVGIGGAVKSAKDSAAYFNSVFSRVGDYVGTLNTSIANGVAGMTRYVQSLTGMSNAQVKATGITKAGTQVFQTYTATVRNADGSFRNYTFAVDKATGATYSMEKGVTSVNNAAVRTGDTFSNLIIKVAKWAAVTTLIYTPIRQFTKAIREMKDVDTELVTIQKVTGATADEMERLSSNAYKVAASYGTTASNYLNSVSEFSKAGYAELADSLGQLSLKTQVVGDVEKETANQFLLSVDAAYKYKGSVEALSAVLDGANEIGNKYATDVQKIAEGLGIVSSVAASANIDISELTAAIGTITAVTQRSGSEAARALRALILNITGNTEIAIDPDSDEAWTAEEIQAMTDALQKFNIATRETVDGVEKLRNPMEVIGDMAMQWEKGLLSEVDLNDLVSDLGGKLRSNQLMALIQNFDMYESMVQDFAGAAGSADKEFGIYMDSWEARLNQLNSAWTNFVASFGIEDFIKDLISFGTTLLTVADSDMGRLIIQIGALTVAFSLLSSAFTAAKTAAVSSGFLMLLEGIITGGKDAAAALQLLTGAMLKSPLFWAVSAGLVIFAVGKVIDSLTVSVEELNEEIDETNTQISEIEGKIADLEAKGASETVIDIYRKKLAALNEDLKELNQQKFDLTFGEITQTDSYTVDSLGLPIYEQANKVQYLIDTLEELKQKQSEIRAGDADALKDYEETEEQINDVTEQLTDYYLMLAEAADQGLRFNDTQKDLYLRLVQMFGAEEDVVRVTAQMTAATSDSMAPITRLIHDLGDEADAAGIAREELYELVAQAIAFNNTELNVTQKISALRQLAAAAGIASSMLGANGNTANDQYRGFMKTMRMKGMDEAEAQAAYWQKVMEDLFPEPVEEEPTRGSGNSSSSSGSGSSGSKSSSETDAELERLKAIVELRKSELDLMEARGDSTEDQIDKMRQIQDALLAQIDYMRTIGADQTDINALAAEYWKINQDINQLLEERQEAAWKELEDYVDGLLEKAQQVRDEQLAAIDDQIDALKKRKEEENEQLTLEEKRLAVQKAMEDLANARNERTIRQIQEDGSWKWVADASNVQSAEDALQAAKDDLAEYEKELAYNAVIDALEAQKAMIEAEYDAFEDQWEAIKDSIEQPSEDIAEILQEIADVGAPAMQNAISSVTDMLDGLANYIGMTINTGPVSGVDGLNGGILGGVGSGGLTLGGRYDSATDYLVAAINAAKNGNLDEAQELWNRRGYKIDAQGGNDRGTSQEDAWDMIMDAYNKWGAGSGGSSSGGGSSGGGGSSASHGGYGSRDEFDNAIHDAFDQAMSSGEKVPVGDSGLYIDPDKVKRSYDSGGIAVGRGIMMKDTAQREMVLDPKTTAMILTPERNARFQSFVKSLGLLFGTSDRVDGLSGMTAGAVSSTDRHDVNYIINGVKIGSDMASRPLSEILSILPLHTERY